MFEPYIIVGGRVRRLTPHVMIRMRQRQADLNWIIQVIESPVAVVDDEEKQSINYYGFIGGKSSLLKVAVSKIDDGPIVTVHFDSGATRRHIRGEL